jgi:hypothetical protein
MGGSGQPTPPRSRPEPVPPSDTSARESDAPLGADSRAGTGRGQESGGPGRKDACPSDFPAEVADIPAAMQARAAGVVVGAELPIELHDDDPAFLLDADVLGWLADNIEEVTECLQAGWRYHGIVRANQSTPAGAVITSDVFGTPPSP